MESSLEEITTRDWVQYLFSRTIPRLPSQKKEPERITTNLDNLPHYKCGKHGILILDYISIHPKCWCGREMEYIGTGEDLTKYKK